MQVSIEGDLHEGICDHDEDCCPHHVSGTIVECSSNFYSNGKKVAIVGDKVIHDCPHCGKGRISSSTSSIYINGKQAAGIDCEVEYEKGHGKIISSGGNICND